MKHDFSPAFRFTAMIAATFAIILAAFVFGPYPMSPEAVLQALLAGPQAGNDAAVVVWRLRLPRIGAALLVGAALSTAGALFQGIFRNPLASPGILGVSSGAGLGAALAIYCGMPLLLVQGAAFGGGLAALSLVAFIAWQVRGHDPVLVLVLAGVCASALFSAGISLVKVLADPTTQLASITFWLLGGLNAIHPGDLVFAALPFALGLVPVMLYRWRINLLSLADEEAAAMGVDVVALRRQLVLCATLMTASATALAGVIGWVGLIVPHAARLIVGPEFSRLLPAVLILGGGFLVLADTLARSLATVELPLGILTALVGAPLFLLLLARSRR